MRILVVDDEAPIVELLAAACTSDGHDVVSCTSSLEAISYLASANRVDLLITDIAMPPPDGLRLVEEARRLQPLLMAIVITGFTSRYSLEDVLACGASDLMIKPFRVQELRARVALAQERRRTVDNLHAKRRELQQASAEMIQGLEEELQHARRIRLRTS